MQRWEAKAAHKNTDMHFSADVGKRLYRMTPRQKAIPKSESSRCCWRWSSFRNNSTSNPCLNTPLLNLPVITLELIPIINYNKILSHGTCSPYMDILPRHFALDTDEVFFVVVQIEAADLECHV